MRALRRADAPDLLDLGAGHRLVIGDDGERLERRARQLALLDRLALSRKARSSAVRNAHLPATRTRLTPRGAYRPSAASAPARHRRPRECAAPGSSRRAARSRRTASPRGCAAPPASPGCARRASGISSSSSTCLRAKPGILSPPLMSLMRRGGRAPPHLIAAAEIERREGRMLLHLEHALAHHFERRGEARRGHRRAHLRFDQESDQELIERPQSRLARAAARAARAPRPATRPCAA